MIFEGWCPDCDLQTVLVDTGDGPEHGEQAWATCTECGVGWTWRDALPEPRSSARDRSDDNEVAARAA
ncbi:MULTISPECIES: hypothetical protein [unclassified Curtobacterium]|uniref:hypothetical protein n=1 Tax=unclassified Curtobacterium TaxID=257496 RepID=UPI000DA88EB5|nr:MULTISPECIES: hypothetical protein [unclassified Curtobacterium]PZE28909.1 hypothetical protein DEI86_03910 [Curtobacterium sp. MCBD17_028]PZE77260.1 hypothetical protein DEI82_04970 [Curtobacterium sp. MCBD17_019]PZF57584.1 hypothetical protein DEI92_12790 [Curtobacterium sp. MCBD17_034]PZM33676.1 hypothetical protein DEI90_11975 [Curtobacterium sp. MCBD17_031]